MRENRLRVGSCSLGGATMGTLTTIITLDALANLTTYNSTRTTSDNRGALGITLIIPGGPCTCTRGSNDPTNFRCRILGGVSSRGGGVGLRCSALRCRGTLVNLGRNGCSLIDNAFFHAPTHRGSCLIAGPCGCCFLGLVIGPGDGVGAVRSLGNGSIIPVRSASNHCITFHS